MVASATMSELAADGGAVASAAAGADTTSAVTVSVGGVAGVFMGDVGASGSNPPL